MTLLFKAMNTGYEAMFAVYKMFELMINELQEGINYLEEEKREKYESILAELKARSNKVLSDAWGVFVDITDTFVKLNKATDLRSAIEIDMPLEEKKIAGFVKNLT